MNKIFCTIKAQRTSLLVAEPLCSLLLAGRPVVYVYNLVLGSPVPRLEKDPDWTGPRLPKTGNSQDRQRPQPWSSLQSLMISEILRPTKDQSNWSQPVLVTKHKHNL